MTFYFSDQASHDVDALTQVLTREWTECHLGGQRAWFRCGFCDTRVAMLVRASTYFEYRHCVDLPYRCQSEKPVDRAIRKVQKIQKRLGDPDWQKVFYPNFPKPKGMGYTKYGKIVATARLALNVIQEGFEAHLPSRGKGALPDRASDD